jgi:hypothetical protein
MAETVASLMSDFEASIAKTGHVVIYSPKGRNRKRFPEGCVVAYASEAEARAASRPEQGYFAAIVSGPSRSSEGFRVYYLARWLD